MPALAEEYGKPDAPLGSYAVLLATYGTLVLGFLGLRHRRRRHPPSLAQVALYGLATHKIARTLTRDRVTSPLRAPFVRYRRDPGKSELTEKPRGRGLRRAVGQLLTCPYCTGPWIAAGLLAGETAAPSATRVVASIFAIVSAADLLHGAHQKLKKGDRKMAIKDVMTRGVKVVGPEDPIQLAAQRMADEDIGFVPVCDGERLVGVITDRDLAIRAVAKGADAAGTRVREVMTDEVTWCFEDEDVDRTAKLMKENDIRRVVVVSRDKKLVGVVALGDLAQKQPGHSDDVLGDVSDAPPNK